MNVVPEVRHAMPNGHCSLQLGVWGALSFPAVPGQSPDESPRGKTPGSSRDPTAYICQKCTFEVIKSSTIFVSLSVTVDKKN